MGWIFPIIGAFLAGVGLNFGTAHDVRQAYREREPQGEIILVDGWRTHVIERGDGDPVVMIHGIGSSSEMFLHGGVLDTVAQRYHVLAVDRPGHGFSERPDGMKGDPREQAAFLHETLQQFDLAKPPVLIAQSWGAIVAAAYAIMYPEEIRGIVFMVPYLAYTQNLFDPIFDLSEFPILTDVMLNTVAVPASKQGRAIFASYFFYPYEVPEDWLGDTILLSQTPDGLRVSAQDMRVVEQAMADLRPHYGEIDVPVTVLVGLMDKIVAPLPTIEIANRHGWELHEFPNAGHSLQIVRTEEVLAVILDALAEME